MTEKVGERFHGDKIKEKGKRISELLKRQYDSCWNLRRDVRFDAGNAVVRRLFELEENMYMKDIVKQYY